MSEIPKVPTINIGNIIERKVQEAHMNRNNDDVARKLTGIEWDKLKINEKNDSISMDESWRTISRALGKELFGIELCVVQNIGDFKYFDLLNVMKKIYKYQQSYTPVTYGVIGQLSELAQKTPEMENNVKQLSKFLKSESYENYSEPLTLSWTNGEKGEKLKSISVTLTNFSTYVLPWNTFMESNITLAVDPEREELSGMKTIYIIDEVVYVDKINIEVTIGEKQAELQIDAKTTRGTPVAIHYEKFSLDQNGFFNDNNGSSEVNPLAKFVKIH